MTGPYVLAAGGTGGHIFPAEALARALIARGERVVLVTDKRGQAFGGDLSDVQTARVRSSRLQSGLIGKARTAVELGVGYRQAKALLRRLKPAAVIGFGGYPSLPTVFAASRLGLKIVLHEQNAVIGRANRMLASRAHRIALSFANVAGIADADRAKTVVTGTPVRPAIAALHDTTYEAPNGGEIRILVLGGSQGARVFSEIVPAAIDRLADDLKARLVITQQARPEDLDEAQAAYKAAGANAHLATFFTDVPERLAACHLAITRAGASTCAELTVAGRPSILVPYPYAADDHQRANALNLVEEGAAWLLPQDGFSAEGLAGCLENLLMLPETLTRAAVDAQHLGIVNAADRLADVALSLVHGGGANGNHPVAEAAE
jgi:UDP-N-acetylglucosamine--N-acetylmuramyl-(pentapeptide) pyrophosphoryl-undecaprenol N-acetylglucosamine transferase